MVKKILIMLALTMMLAVPAMGQRYRRHSLSIVDEFGRPVTSITSITVFNAGLATSPTIYNDRAGTLTVTNPITPTSTNSTFDQATGTLYWFQTAPDFKVTITDGTKTLTIDNMNESDTRFPWFANYIGTAASLSVTDNQSITVGTDSDMVLAWNNASGFLSWVPAADGSKFNIGTSGTGANCDFNVFVGTAIGLKIDEGAATCVIDGMTTSINASSNFNTNINTGTSTGNVTIGSSTSGTLALDTTAGMTINADDSIDMTTSGAAADIDIDAAAGSVIIDGGQAAADAVSIVAGAGGIDITSAATYDIDITATGGTVQVVATEAAANQFKVDAQGAVAGNAIVLETTSGGIQLLADHATNGDITLDAEDDIILTTTGALTITNTSAATISGALSVTGITTVAAINQQVVVVPDGAAYDVLAANTGKVHVIPGQTADITLDLPTEAAGLYYKFVYVGGAEDAQDWIIDSENNTNFFIGGLMTIDDDDHSTLVVYSDGSDDSIMTILTPGAGTVIEIWCDGTNWYVTGLVISGTDTAVTFTNL